MDESGEKVTDKAISLPQIVSNSNLTAGKVLITFIDNTNLTINSSAFNTSAHNGITEQTDKTFATREILEKYSESSAEDSVFRRSRVDCERYQAEVPDIAMGSNADLNKKAEEVKTRCQFEVKDSLRLDLINNFLQFAQRLSNEWASAGGSAP
jgi:hypothetical protein